MLLSYLLVVLSAALGASGASWIVPGAVWTDTAGNKIDAHGGGIYQENGTFYWIGQSASNNEAMFMYSSTDLLNWTPHGAQGNSRFIWRPKIAKINSTYWIFGQENRLIQAFKSDTIIGGYSVQGNAVQIPPDNLTYSDEGMFEDTDGAWYILTSADHNSVEINRINLDGSIGTRVSQLKAGPYEAPGLFKVDDVYFLIASNKTGYLTNPNKMFYSKSLTGNWTGPYDIAPGSNDTYGSQNTFDLVINGTEQTTYIFMGDAWDSEGSAASNYMWTPMAVNSSTKSVILQYHAMWKVDPETGIVTLPTTSKRYEAERAKMYGRSLVKRCKKCLSKRAVHKIDRNSKVAFKNVRGTGFPQWVSFHYTVNNPEAGDAWISINDDPKKHKISAYNSRAGYHKTVPIELTLKRGAVNTIYFGAIGFPTFEMVLDGIEVHEDELQEICR